MKTTTISKFLCTAFAGIACLMSYARYNASALVPYPNHIEIPVAGDAFEISESTTIQSYLPNDGICLSTLQDMIKRRMGLSLPAQREGAENAIELRLDDSLENDEHYAIDISSDKAVIRGKTQAAVFYGLQTLDQILIGDIGNTRQRRIAPISIDDAPRFEYRALMLDPARNFLPIEDIKFFIDQMARFKYNALQLHLTDDQGWRIEIKSHPELTEIGANRNPTAGAGAPDNGYYTQDQIKDLIEYASQRNIEIVPELDIPGHTAAVLAAHPELACTPTDTAGIALGKTDNLMICADKDDAYSLYKDIIEEVAALFPSKKIHLGGDEAAIPRNWGACEHCNALMKKLGYTEPSQLMNHFFGIILGYVRDNGKEPVLWCELDNIYLPANAYLFDYPADAILTTWRYGLTPLCIELTAKHGNKLIMAPGEYAYLDYPQYKNDLPEYNNWGMPTTTLEQCYGFDPGYGLPEQEQQHIIGVMGTLWGEAIKDINRASYMAFPRALALAEAAWTDMDSRSWESFKERIMPNLSDMMKRGVSVRAPYEIGRQNEF